MELVRDAAARENIGNTKEDPHRLFSLEPLNLIVIRFPILDALICPFYILIV